MPIIIPTRSLPAYSFEINIEGRVYRLRFEWNSRHEHWTMAFLTRTGEDIIRGIKLIINFEIINRYKNPQMPPGALIPLDRTGRLERIGRNDLGEDVKLIYYTRAELDEFIQ